MKKNGVRMSCEPLAGSETYFHTPSPQGRETFLYPLCWGRYFCDERYEVSRSSYDSYLLMFIVAGEGYVEYEESMLHFEAGQMVLIDCYRPHRYGAAGALEFYWLHFDGVGARKYYELLQGKSGAMVFLGADRKSEAEMIFQKLIAGGSGKTGLQEIQFGKYITDLLTIFGMANDEMRLDASGEADTSEAVCEQARIYMQQSFMQPLSVEEIAEYASLSKYYFIRRFKELYSTTPHRYLLNIRLDSAKYFLRTTNRTVKSIALSCGFQCENHFCIAFKKQMRMTPGEYRKH